MLEPFLDFRLNYLHIIIMALFLFQGLIVDKSNSYDPAFYASGVTLIAASLMMFLRRWAQRHTSVNPQNCRQVLTLNMEDNEVLKIFERETVL